MVTAPNNTVGASSRAPRAELLDARRDGAIERAAQIIRAGGLVAFPTETVYGLGALGLDPLACARIFEAKRRPHFDPLILHVAEVRAVDAVGHMQPTAIVLAERFWPGPLTLVLPRHAVVPDIVTSGMQTVAVRVPAHPVAHRLLEAVGTPVAAPSANPFGRLSPTTAEHVAAGLGDRIDAILDGGPADRGLESTIIDVTGDAPALLRAGAIALEEIESLLGRVIDRRLSSSRPAAPGQLEAHYAPRTPLLLSEPGASTDLRAAGLLTLTRREGDDRFAAVEELSASGDLCQAAVRFFAALHRLDERGLDVIYARPLSETGLGVAIMDRLRRAASMTRR
ncbi:MAG: threonylcarbamoyl-AMP synthase [Actinobacteria bacterium]|nr:threonylcarbamoyl-AMP synthase [Actinomycetota bacterium]